MALSELIETSNDSEMTAEQLRVMAEFMRLCQGTDSFRRAIEFAATLSSNGQLSYATVWYKIADEIAKMEAEEAVRAKNDS